MDLRTYVSGMRTLTGVREPGVLVEIGDGEAGEMIVSVQSVGFRNQRDLAAALLLAVEKMSGVDLSNIAQTVMTAPGMDDGPNGHKYDPEVSGASRRNRVAEALLEAAVKLRGGNDVAKALVNLATTGRCGRPGCPSCGGDTPNGKSHDTPSVDQDAIRAAVQKAFDGIGVEAEAVGVVELTPRDADDDECLCPSWLPGHFEDCPNTKRRSRS